MQVLKEKNNSRPKNLIWDQLGIGTSLLCAIHCTVLPLFASSIPILGINVLENKWLEVLTIFLSFLFGFSAILRKNAGRKTKFPVAVFVTGFIALVANQAVEGLEWVLIPFATLFIVTAHLLNLFSGKRVIRQYN